ncbi:hypothetical protein M413DRAFT_448290 [Hebeloma cylindrosporum]|uniref:MARVEL domain-containing protein n=1 Tax=Hebeloma cylindrosporum TaxID=76867 RepID=A0A0C2Y9S4_HEBCY|nr:hypothetical protein M413DRAFT_448290 [Hebeloma cylindrosporum h7]
MVVHIIRAFLYVVLFIFSVILLGLSGYRVHYTKGLHNGDILTTSTNFYDPTVVELIVTSSLAIIFSLWFFMAILARVGRGPFGTYASEFICIFIIWVMFLVGAAVFTHKYHNLKWCRGGHKVCRILETIKAFAWMCWCWTFFLLIAGFANMLANKHGISGPVHGRRDDVGTYPQTNRTTAPATTAVHTQPVATPQPQVQQVQQLSTA